MTKEEIKVVIKKDGSIKIEGVGFTGPTCTAATQFLEKELGSVETRTLKADYHRKPDAKIQQKQGA